MVSHNLYPINNSMFLLVFSIIQAPYRIIDNLYEKYISSIIFLLNLHNTIFYITIKL